MAHFHDCLPNGGSQVDSAVVHDDVLAPASITIRAVTFGTLARHIISTRASPGAPTDKIVVGRGPSK
jgi:hypothetical protein